MRDIRVVKNEAIKMGIIMPDNAFFNTDYKAENDMAMTFTEIYEQIMIEYYRRDSILEAIKYMNELGYITPEFINDKIHSDSILYNLLLDELKHKNYFFRKSEFENFDKIEKIF